MSDLMQYFTAHYPLLVKTKTLSQKTPLNRMFITGIQP